MSDGELGARRTGSAGLALGGLLLAGALLQVVAPLIGIVRTANGSAPGVAGAASFALLLGPLLALIVQSRRPVAGLALLAGVGITWTGRLLSDIGVLTGPGDSVRPELFFERSVRALPLRSAPGGLLLLAGDVLVVVAGVLAARRLALVLSGDGPATVDPVWRSAEKSAPVTAGVGRSHPLALHDAAAAVDPDDLIKGANAVQPTDSTDSADSSDRAGRRVSAQVLAGLLGAVAALVGAVGIPYRAGYLDGRALPPSLGLWALTGALVLACVAAAAVLTATVLPRTQAVALLAGVAAVVGTPVVTGFLVLLSDSGVRVDSTVWASLVGAVLLTISVPLFRPRPASAGAVTVNRSRVVAAQGLAETDPGPALPGALAAALAAVAAALALVASRTSGLQLDGRPDPPQPSGHPLSAPIGAPFGWVALLLAGAALLAVLPPTAVAGRAAVALAWIPGVWAVGTGLVVYGTVQASAGTTSGIPGTAIHVWTAGPGLWAGSGSVVVSLLAATAAVVSVRRQGQLSIAEPNEEALDRHRTISGAIAGGCGLVVLIADLFPVFGTASGDGSSLISAFGVDGVGMWLLLLGSVAGLVAAARTLQLPVVLGAGATVAAAGLIRLVVPVSVRAQDGFRLRTGLPATLIGAVAVTIGTAVIAASLRRVHRTGSAGDHPVTVGKGRSRASTSRSSSASAAGSVSASASGVRRAAPGGARPGGARMSGKPPKTGGSRPTARGPSGKGRR